MKLSPTMNNLYNALKSIRETGESIKAHPDASERELLELIGVYRDGNWVGNSHKGFIIKAF
jgi:hypothetical protein